METDSMPAAAPDFLSFNGVVAIVVILILLGRALDWILLKSHQILWPEG